VSDIDSSKLKIGDLVIYAPYYSDGDGSWYMSGDMGIVVGLKLAEDKRYHIAEVRWVTDDLDSKVDMAADVLKKINVDK
tara:strand:+ start:84 stop:320 length:237 start_codon:yes stop_codon:yes gene_type:complete